MSKLVFPVDRRHGRAIVVGSAACRASAVGVLGSQGYQTVEAEDPYLAMAMLCAEAGGYDAVVLSLASLYREEVAVVGAIKRRYSQAEIWLAHTDGRAGALAEALRLGADGLISEEGLHRFATVGERPTEVVEVPDEREGERVGELAAREDRLSNEVHERSEPGSEEPALGEPILTAEELRALLHDPPIRPAVERELAP